MSKYSLEKGFLFDYKWEHSMRQLSAEDFTKVFWDLVDFQKSSGAKQIENYSDNPLLDVIVSLIMPQIQSRIDGAKRGVEPPCSTPVQHPRVTHKIRQDKIRQDKSSKDIHPLPPKRGKQASYDAGFEEFWKVYPKKQSKQTALKAWEKLKPDSDLTREIIEAVQARCRSQEWKDQNGKFVPLPASYLNQQRWMDEICVSDADNHSIKATESDDIEERILQVSKQKVREKTAIINESKTDL